MTEELWQRIALSVLEELCHRRKTGAQMSNDSSLPEPEASCNEQAAGTMVRHIHGFVGCTRADC